MRQRGHPPAKTTISHIAARMEHTSSMLGMQRHLHAFSKFRRNVVVWEMHILSREYLSAKRCLDYGTTYRTRRKLPVAIKSTLGIKHYFEKQCKPDISFAFRDIVTFLSEEGIFESIDDFERREMYFLT